MFSAINLALTHLYMAKAATPTPGAEAIIGQGAKSACPVNAAGDSVCGVSNINGLFTSVTSILLFIVGAISVIMIIVGALRYVLSAGDGKNTAAAKDTILYAIVGLVIALSAYAIITFVTGHVK